LNRLNWCSNTLLNKKLKLLPRFVQNFVNIAMRQQTQTSYQKNQSADKRRLKTGS